MPGINSSVRHAARRQFAFVASAAAVAVAHAASADVPAPATPPPYVLPTAPTDPREGTVSATADNSNSLSTYGPAVTFGRTTGTSYSGIGTTVTGTTLTVGTTTTTPITGTARPQFGSSAWIRAGRASSDTTVSMQWRTATQYEV
jgi:hypothetical protein